MRALAVAPSTSAIPTVALEYACTLLMGGSAHNGNRAAVRVMLRGCARQVDRILEKYAGRKDKPDEFLVKWMGLEYSDATWETETEVNRDGRGRVRHSNTLTPVSSACTAR